MLQLAQQPEGQTQSPFRIMYKLVLCQAEERAIDSSKTSVRSFHFIPSLQGAKGVIIRLHMLHLGRQKCSALAQALHEAMTECPRNPRFVDDAQYVIWKWCENILPACQRCLASSI